MRDQNVPVSLRTWRKRSLEIGRRHLPGLLRDASRIGAGLACALLIVLTAAAPLTETNHIPLHVRPICIRARCLEGSSSVVVPPSWWGVEKVRQMVSSKEGDDQSVLASHNSSEKSFVIYVVTTDLSGVKEPLHCLAERVFPLEIPPKFCKQDWNVFVGVE